MLIGDYFMRLRYLSALPALAVPLRDSRKTDRDRAAGTRKLPISMAARLAALALLLGAPALFASDERYPIGRSSNDFVEISANLLLDKEQIRQAIGPNIAGSDLGGSVVVVQVTVRPLGDDPVKIWLDDFMLLSDKDGQRSVAFQPSQIAGAGAIIVKNAAAGKGSTTVVNHGAGGDIMGMPIGGPVIGNGVSATPSAEVEVKDAEDDTESPLLVALRQKVLPEKSVTEPVTGLLYFEIDGKVKAKNLELFYKTRSGTLGLRFVPEKGEKGK